MWHIKVDKMHAMRHTHTHGTAVHTAKSSSEVRAAVCNDDDGKGVWFRVWIYHSAYRAEKRKDNRMPREPNKKTIVIKSYPCLRWRICVRQRRSVEMPAIAYGAKQNHHSEHTYYAFKYKNGRILRTDTHSRRIGGINWCAIKERECYRTSVVIFVVNTVFFFSVAASLVVSESPMPLRWRVYAGRGFSVWI